MVVSPPADTAASTQHTPTLGVRDLVLASASPRRRELLGFLGITYRLAATDAEDRDIPPSATLLAALPALHIPLHNHPTLLAWRKASDVAAQQPHACVLAADTTVVLDDQVLNKPQDARHAATMLHQLAGRTHTVYTGLCLIAPETSVAAAPPTLREAGWQIWLDLVASNVEIAPLSLGMIAEYVATGEPLDKAGAYGIQGLGGKLVRTVVGSYTNVVGLPLAATRQLLVALGLPNLHDPEAAYHAWLQSQGKEPLPCPPTHP